MGRASNYAVKIHTTDETTAVVLGNITSLDWAHNVNVETPDTGDAYAPGRYATTGRPMMNFSTLSLKTLLDNINWSGKCIASDGTHPGVVGYNRKHDSCTATGSAATGHASATVSKGHLFLQTISGSPGSLVSASCVVHGTADIDSEDNPLTIAYNATLPEASDRSTDTYVVGRPKVAGIEINDATNVSVSTNVLFDKPEYAGGRWPTIVDITKIDTLISIDLDDVTILDATKIPVDGTVAALGDSSLHYIQQRQADHYEYGDNAHILMPFKGLAMVTQPYSASGGGRGSARLEVAVLSDDGVAPISVSTSSPYVPT